MPERDRLATIGIFGGTFDPVHFGHLRSALEVYEKLKLDSLRLIPSRHPPHRSATKASAEHRFNMVNLAVEQSPLQVDDREIQREGPSYSVDTLMSLRREHPKASICMIVGVDAFLGLSSWHQWEKLIQLANIVVMYRAGWELPKKGLVADMLHKHALLNTESIANHASGYIVTQTVSTMDISASNIRTIISDNRSPAFLIPEKVWEYIQKHGLYGYDRDIEIH